MPNFEPTIPFGEPELMRVSGFRRYLDELARNAPEGAPSTRLWSLSPSLTQDLMRFEQAGREADVLEVMAACVRHARSLTVHLQRRDKVLALTVFPRARVVHCALDLKAMLHERREPLAVLRVEPALLRPPGDATTALVGEPQLYRPLAELLWALALRGTRDALLPELGGAAVYRVAPSFELSLLRRGSVLYSAVQRLRRAVASQREIAAWPGMNRERATRLLNALYLQAGLIVSRSHPAALGDSWFSARRAAPSAPAPR